MVKVMEWDIYEISSAQPIQGVDFRGKLREFSIEADITMLVDNAADKENVVRFAVPAGNDAEQIISHAQAIVPGVVVSLEYPAVANPSITKMWVNRIEIDRN